MLTGYGAAVLAGGSGRRMGKVNKAQLIYQGQTFAGHLYDELRALDMPVYVSVASYQQEVPEGFVTVPDFAIGTHAAVDTDIDEGRHKSVCVGAAGRYAGPMGGICSCLVKAREDGLDGLFFCPCDAPLFDRKVIERLADHIGAEDDAVIWKTADGRLQTAFGYYSVSALPVMERDLEKGLYKLVKYLEEVSCRIISTGENGLSDSFFVNINTEEDYRNLLGTGSAKEPD